MIDSVGGMWVGSLDEMSDEIKTGNRFKKQKYKSFILKLAPYLQMRK
jgi:hypothetical protein